MRKYVSGNPNFGFLGTIRSKTGSAVIAQALYDKTADSIKYWVEWVMKDRYTKSDFDPKGAVLFLDSRNGRRLANWAIKNYGIRLGDSGLFALAWDGDVPECFFKYLPFLREVHNKDWEKRASRGRRRNRS